jgi:hypothetical protein
MFHGVTQPPSAQLALCCIAVNCCARPPVQHVRCFPAASEKLLVVGAAAVVAVAAAATCLPGMPETHLQQHLEACRMSPGDAAVSPSHQAHSWHCA